MHWIKSDSLILFNFTNFDWFPETLTSLARSKFLIVSTLSSLIKSNVLVTETADDPIESLDPEVIPVSAKFFNPAVCNKLLTGDLKSSNSIGLIIVY